MHQQSSAHRRTGTTEHREMRECRSCYGCGTVVHDVEYSEATGELVQEVVGCPICHGAGEVSVYLYPKRGRRPDVVAGDDL